MLKSWQRHDSTQLELVLQSIRVPRPGGGGCPCQRPRHVIADKGDNCPRCQRWLRHHHIPHTISARIDQQARRSRRPGRPLAFKPAIYARHNVIERYITRLNQWWGLAAHYEKRVVNYRAMVVLASIVLWLSSLLTRQTLRETPRMNSFLRAAYWFIAGGVIGVGVIAILSIGAIFLAVGLALTVFGVLRVGTRELWAALVGGGVVPLSILLYDLSQPIQPMTTAQSYWALAVVFGVIAVLGLLVGLIERLRRK